MSLKFLLILALNTLQSNEMVNACLLTINNNSSYDVTCVFNFLENDLVYKYVSKKNTSKSSYLVAKTLVSLRCTASIGCGDYSARQLLNMAPSDFDTYFFYIDKHPTERLGIQMRLDGGINI